MKYCSYQDEDLILAVRNRDVHAFNEIYNRNWEKLYRTANKIINKEAVAQDVVQEVFISFWEKGCFSLIGNIEGYLYQSIKFKCFMSLRAGAISQKHLNRMNAVIYANVIEEEYNLRELESMLEKGMASLPEKCRKVFYLSRFESLSNKKIAEQLHISPKTVENQITKALRVLRLSISKLAVLFFFLMNS